MSDTQKNLGPFQTGKALQMLYEHAAPLLSDEELELMTKANDYAQHQAQNWAEIIDGLAAAINCDTTGFFDNQMTTFLIQVGYQFEQIAGLIAIGSEAEYRLQNPDKVSTPRQSGTDKKC